MESKCSKKNLSWKSAFRMKSRTTDIKTQSRKPSTPSHFVVMESDSLENKYGRPNKMLSDEGAGGSILLVTRQRDNTTFAVKRFRRRHSIEDELIYTRQIVKEFYCGARLHHHNIIKTLDLFEEHSQYLQVMEYAPYCLFDRVMSRKMSTEEIDCAFMQILAGANYLHCSGFAHRDLKLENVVITDSGIMKLIDFGGATICKQPGVRSATGFVGSLPYMAPEILTNYAYDPQKSDVWSVAIVYCCMVLGRFPWKSPDRSDDAFCLFTAIEPLKIQLPSQNIPSRASRINKVTVINVSVTENDDDKQKFSEKVLGSWGILRKLPSESRGAIEAMLAIDPSTRQTLDRIMKMSWIAQAQSCSEDVDGRLHAISGHQHH